MLEKAVNNTRCSSVQFLLKELRVSIKKGEYKKVGQEIYLGQEILTKFH